MFSFIIYKVGCCTSTCKNRLIKVQKENIQESFKDKRKQFSLIRKISGVVDSRSRLRIFTGSELPLCLACKEINFVSLDSKFKSS